MSEGDEEKVRPLSAEGLPVRPLASYPRLAMFSCWFGLLREQLRLDRLDGEPLRVHEDVEEVVPGPEPRLQFTQEGIEACGVRLPVQEGPIQDCEEPWRVYDKNYDHAKRNLGA